MKKYTTSGREATGSYLTAYSQSELPPAIEQEAKNQDRGGASPTCRG